MNFSNIAILNIKDSSRKWDYLSNFQLKLEKVKEPTLKKILIFFVKKNYPKKTFYTFLKDFIYQPRIDVIKNVL